MALPFGRLSAVQKFSRELLKVQALSLKTFRVIGPNPDPQHFMCNRRGTNKVLLDYLLNTVPGYPRIEDDDQTLLEVEANVALARHSTVDAIEHMAARALQRIQTLIQTTAGDRYRLLLAERGRQA